MKYETRHTFGLDGWGIVYSWTDETCNLHFESDESICPSHKLTVMLDKQNLKQLLATILWTLSEESEPLIDILDNVMEDIYDNGN